MSGAFRDVTLDYLNTRPINASYQCLRQLPSFISSDSYLDSWNWCFPSYVAGIVILTCFYLLHEKKKTEYRKLQESNVFNFAFKLVLKLSLCFKAYCCRPDSEIGRELIHKCTIGLSARHFLFPNMSVQQLFLRCLVLGRRIVLWHS